MQQLIKKKSVKVIFIAVFLILIISINPKRLFDPVRNFANTLLYPFQKVTYLVAHGFASTGDFLNSIGELKKENVRLLNENNELTAKNALLGDAESENSKLRAELELLPRDQWNLIGAYIISQDSQGTGNWLEIDRGSDDGIEVGMSVIVSKSILVGKIQQVSAKTSQVILLTNSQSAVNAIVSSGTAKGILRGEYGLAMILGMVPQADVIAVGDNIVTSGIGGEVPRGLYIGKVQEIRNANDGLFQQAVVISPIQISKQQVVFVIKRS